MAMITMSKSLTGWTVALMAVAGLATRAVAVDTAWQTNSGGAYSGLYTNTEHWSGGAVPGSTDHILFTNAQGVAYTVTFDQTALNDTLIVYNDKVVFDLAGFTWTNNQSTALPWTMFGSNSNPAEVTFTSSSGLSTAIVGALNTRTYVRGLGTAVTITNVLLRARGDFVVQDYATINVLGPGAELRVEDVEDDYGVGGIMNVLDGATFQYLGFLGGSFISPSNVVLTVSGGSTLRNQPLPSPYFYSRVGKGRDVSINLLDNSVWDHARQVVIGFQRDNGGATAAPYNGDVYVDDSTIWADTLVIGGAGATSNGRLVLTNASTLNVTNGYMLVGNNAFSGNTNTLVLNGSSIRLGRPTVDGVLTNRGIMKASGTITGLGSGPGLVRNERLLQVGNSIGTLTLSNMNLELAAGSENLWEFDPDTAGSSDLIDITAGTASVLGSNVFSTFGGSTLTFGTWDFVRASSITFNPQFDNLTNLIIGLTNTLPEGLFAGYTYGVVDMGGYQALQLSINMIPEPSTVLLVLVGGWLLFRRRRWAR